MPAPAPGRSRRTLTLVVVVGLVASLLVLSLVAMAMAHDERVGCYVALGERLEGDAILQGGDLVRARQAGYDDDGDLESLSDAQRRTGTSPDPLTWEALQRYEVAADRNGFAPADVSCWVGTSQAALLQGTFDDAAVAGSERGGAGDLVSADDTLAFDRGGNAEAVLAARADDREPDPAALAALAVLDEEAAYSFFLTGLDDARWVGLGIADAERGRDMVVVWAYADPDAAEADLDAVADRLDDGDLDRVVRIGPDDLEQLDEVIVARGRLVVEAARWTTPLQLFDPALVGDIGG